MASITTTDSAASWRPDIAAFAPSDVIPDAIILSAATVAGSIEGDAPMLRVPYVDDDTAAFIAEGDEIPEGDPDLSEVLVATAKISQLLRLSREQFEQEGTAQELGDSVRRAIVKKANIAFLTQAAPTNPAVTPPAGLLNVAGIVNGGAVATHLDALIDVIATLESNGGAPTGIILDPVAWARLRKFKTGTGSAASLLGAGTMDSTRMLLDLPVTVTPALAAGTGLIVDSAATVAAAGQVQVAQSTDAYFSSDSIALRATWRIGWNLVRPNRLAKFTVTAPA